MSDREHHCPFLNRSDNRCSQHFSMHDMQHAFEHCFDAYKSCGVYRELLAERQTRRGQAAAGSMPAMRFLWATACKPAVAEAASDVSQQVADASRGQQQRTPFVQLRVPTGHIAAAAAVSTALALAAQ